MQPQQLAKLWEATQVELQGRYSNKRVLELAKYTRETSSLRALAVVFASPFPCLFVTFLIDAIPLRDPSEGIAANKAFFVREFLCVLLTTGMIIHQFRRGMHYILPYPVTLFVRDCLVVSVLTIVILYGLVRMIGFPLPFTSVVLSPAWSAMTLGAMAIQWASKIQGKPSAKAMLLGMGKLMLCDALLLFIYPPYFHIFKTLPVAYKTVFTLLLPVIKLFMRNLFARAVSHLGDETPELVIFNADTFGSLFVSYCMQNSPSIWSTIVIMTSDAALIGLALRDIKHCRDGLEELETHIDCGPIWKNCQGTLGYKLLGGRKPTILERAGILLERGETTTLPAANLGAVMPLDLSQQQSQLGSTENGVVICQTTRRNSSLMPNISRLSIAWMGENIIHPEETNDRPRQSRIPISTQFTHTVRRLLYMAEFLLLLNYIEVVMSQIFAIYFIITYYLPNRKYYKVFDDMSANQLYETLYDLAIYWCLQLVSMVCLNLMLQRLLGLSPLRLLAFVLEKQVDYVQIHLTFWLFYNAQCALEHFGYDYTFQFAWLSNSAGNGSQSA